MFAIGVEDSGDSARQVRREAGVGGEGRLERVPFDDELRAVGQAHGEADDGESGLLLIRKLKPDLALVDLHMPNVNGIEVTERVRRGKLPTRIVGQIHGWWVPGDAIPKKA